MRNKAKKGADNHASKSVKQYDKDYNYIRTWAYATEASKTLGIDLSSIIKCCRGKRNIAGGYIWEYSNLLDESIKPV